MAKINQEEYQVLKAWISKWKWLARTERGAVKTFLSKPHKRLNWLSGGSGSWDTKGNEDFGIYTTYADLFQFIQWEDEEPYNIAELIEEYERYEIENIHVERKHPMFNCNRFNGFYNANIAIWDRLEESEETEVKNIEWAKKIIRLVIDAYRYDGQPLSWELLKGDITRILDQLDEPETLSQEWIDKYKCWDEELDAGFVYVEELQNLLVPKQGKVKEDAENIKEECWKELEE